MRHEAEDLAPWESCTVTPANSVTLYQQHREDRGSGKLYGRVAQSPQPPASPCINNTGKIVEQETYMEELSQTTQAPSLLSHINITPWNSLRSRPQREEFTGSTIPVQQETDISTYYDNNESLSTYAYVKTHALQTSQLTRTDGSFKLINNDYSNLFTKQENV